MDSKRPRWLARTISVILHLVCFGFLAVAYLFAAVIWDEMASEYYVYNYTWNFALIDFCVWKLVPAFAFCFLLWRLVNIFRNTTPEYNTGKRLREP